MRADERHAAAPLQAWQCDGIPLALLLLERELIAHTPATLTRLGIRVAGQAVNGLAVGIVDPVGLFVLLAFKEDEPAFLGRDGVRLVPLFTVLAKQPCLSQVTRRNPGVALRSLLGSLIDAHISLSPGNPGLTAFLNGLLARTVGSPARLERQQEGRHHTPLALLLGFLGQQQVHKDQKEEKSLHAASSKSSGMPSSARSVLRAATVRPAAAGLVSWSTAAMAAARFASLSKSFRSRSSI